MSGLNGIFTDLLTENINVYEKQNKAIIERVLSVNQCLLCVKNECCDTRVNKYIDIESDIIGLNVQELKPQPHMAHELNWMWTPEQQQQQQQIQQ